MVVRKVTVQFVVSKCEFYHFSVICEDLSLFHVSMQRLILVQRARANFRISKICAKKIRMFS